MNSVPLFRTCDLDLAAFLLMEGIKLQGLERKSPDSSKIELYFLDEKQICYDLERVFLSSSFKKFRDLNKYLLKQVHSKLKESTLQGALHG